MVKQVLRKDLNITQSHFQKGLVCQSRNTNKTNIEEIYKKVLQNDTVDGS